MGNTQWIGPDESLQAGDVGFLVERVSVADGTSRYHLSATPARASRTHRPRLYGWCGTADGVTTYAYGAARVTRLAKSGRGQALVRVLKGAELAEALAQHGYPDLVE